MYYALVEVNDHPFNFFLEHLKDLQQWLNVSLFKISKLRLFISVYILPVKSHFRFGENNCMKKKIIICLMKYCRFI